MGQDDAGKASAPVAIFDLDYTLLNGDTENLWCQFLFQKGLVSEDFVQQITGYYREYEQGDLDIHRYEAVFLRPLTFYPLEMLYRLRAEYLDQIRKLIRPDLKERMNLHLQQNHTLLLITAANDFLAEPVAAILGFQHLICTKILLDQGKFTTDLDGIPAFRAGKVQLLREWLSKSDRNLEGSWGYSDSHNDMQLLCLTEHPVAVSPDPVLREYATLHGWEIIDEGGESI